MSDPKWKRLHSKLLNERETIACAYNDDGTISYYLPRIGQMVNGRSVKALLDRDLIRPCGALIDPETPQYFEAISG